ncbi:MAG: hypothetical protein ACLFV8_12200 [Alphaproteobacteria bacterium]
MKGRCKAVAYLGTWKIDECDGKTKEDAVDALKRLLDERAGELRRGRSGPVPSADEYREALMALQAGQYRTVLKLLAAHGRRPELMITAAELARISETDESGAIAAYVRLGRALGSFLEFSPDTAGCDRALVPVLTFAAVETLPGRGGRALWLRPEVAAALDALHCNSV